MEEKGAEATEEEEECERDGVGRESLSGTAAWSEAKSLFTCGGAATCAKGGYH